MTDFTGDRRQFFQRALGSAFERVAKAAEDRVVHRRYVRPPGALPEIGFLAACTRCGQCAPVCPVGAIAYIGPDGGFAAGTPKLDPANIPCIACPDMPCAKACPTDALTVPDAGWKGHRLGTITFHPNTCVTFSGETCGICARVCPVGEDALSLDDDGRPILKAEGCVACGVCVRECPTSPSSFTFTPLEP